ncbi:NUDIX hydrolase [Aquibacillus saliphilus]|uniref:NUDIX hydrolase n=1 Tax=Aquibacillus saliphilus TaxID=1909422 RepID=UPI001CF091DE|nr:NUDIX domain-containing protein [Aquibacillus saliphilus]
MEFLDVYDETGNYTGVASRKEVHKEGLWHQTFHCWIVSQEAEKKYLLFQIRQKDKDLFPNLLDISAAGHLLAGESVVDGCRELEEEMGIVVDYNELNFVGIINEKLEGDNFSDFEFCNVFLYKTKLEVNEFNIQEEELAGLVKIELTDIFNLFLGNLDEVAVDGFKQEAGERTTIYNKVTRDDFVPHQLDYYLTVFRCADKIKDKTSAL